MRSTFPNNQPPKNHDRLHKSVLIQMADGRHVELMRITEEHHRQYADIHGMDYRCVYGNPITGKRAGWGKIPLLLEGIAMGYETVIWLDADAVVIRRDVSIANLCDSGIGMVRHPNPKHWNSGFIVSRSGPEQERFWKLVDAAPENDHPWMEQVVINELAASPEFANMIHALDPEYNSVPGVVMGKQPVILAGHGLMFERRKAILRQGVGRPLVRNRHPSCPLSIGPSNL